MVSLNKSFLFGIAFASVTWLISIYLYWQLNKRETYALLLTEKPIAPKKYENSINKIVDYDQKVHNSKNEFELKKKNYDYVNSRKLIKQLQPVKSSSSDNQDLNELGMVKTLEDKKVRDNGYKVHAFNVIVSNALSYHRSVPDTRNQLCKSVRYPDDLPTASIIICFYNEHSHTLLRTVHSVLDRTPSAVLEEIILIDDYSDIEGLHSNISEYINKNLDKRVRLWKTDRREGLIRARLLGTRKSVGKVIIFLDSHVEVNVDWIQPLLLRIKENRTNVVIPVIDIINADTFSYSASPLVRGGFNWGLHFKWDNLPTGTLSKNEDFIKPLMSPTMAGGLFAMDRQYFIDLGEYDAGMNIWGGENLEISFRIWMCGGRLEIIPCSRVGHVFRHRRPYGDPNGQDTMLHNSLRVAHVWMDNYKEYFLKQRSDAKSTNYGDISSRAELRKELKCHDFDWYLKNIYPQLALPTDNEERLKNKWAALEQNKYQPWHSRKRNYIAQYQIRLANSSLCMQSSGDVKSKGSSLVLKNCVRAKAQIWYETDKNEFVLAQLLCLQASQPIPILYKCHEMGADQEWKHKGESNTPIYNMAAGTCLGVDSKQSGSSISMKLCTDPTLITWDLVR